MIGRYCRNFIDEELVIVVWEILLWNYFLEGSVSFVEITLFSGLGFK